MKTQQCKPCPSRSIPKLGTKIGMRRSVGLPHTKVYNLKARKVLYINRRRDAVNVVIFSLTSSAVNMSVLFIFQTILNQRTYFLMVIHDDRL